MLSGIKVIGVFDVTKQDTTDENVVAVADGVKEGVIVGCGTGVDVAVMDAVRVGVFVALDWVADASTVAVKVGDAEWDEQAERNHKQQKINKTGSKFRIFIAFAPDEGMESYIRKPDRMLRLASSWLFARLLHPNQERKDSGCRSYHPTCL
jgi:hypothetical protein